MKYKLMAISVMRAEKMPEKIPGIGIVIETKHVTSGERYTQHTFFTVPKNTMQSIQNMVEIVKAINDFQKGKSREGWFLE